MFAIRSSQVCGARATRTSVHQGHHVNLTIRQHGRARQSTLQTQASDLDLARLSDLISSEDLDPERRFAMERVATALDVPLGRVKNMAFKRKGILSLTPEDIASRIAEIAKIVEVDKETARQMVVIQPGLLFDTQQQAETLKYGIQAICFELDAPKDEVVSLILNNQSVLHGKELRLSVADMAHLAMLREPTGRIVD